MSLAAQTAGADPSQGIAYVDGAYVPLAEAAIPMTDRGFVRSDATYDVAHVWKGRFFRLRDHIDRFFASMAGLRMDPGLTQGEIAAIVHRCVALSGLEDSYVQMTCTRGVPAPGNRDPRACVNRFTAFAQPFVWIAKPDQQATGVSMIVSSHQRIPPEAVDPRIKNFHWLDLTMGTLEAYDRGAHIPVLPDRDGNVTEGPGFNLFAVKGRTLVTPERGVFEGMTRRTVLDLAPDLQLKTEVRALPVPELLAAEEVFVTSTAGGIMPVTTLDGRAIGDGKPGPISRLVHEAYWRAHDDDRWSTPVDDAS